MLDNRRGAIRSISLSETDPEGIKDASQGISGAAFKIPSIKQAVHLFSSVLSVCGCVRAMRISSRCPGFEAVWHPARYLLRPAFQFPFISGILQKAQRRLHPQQFSDRHCRPAEQLAGCQGGRFGLILAADRFTFKAIDQRKDFGDLKRTSTPSTLDGCCDLTAETFSHTAACEKILAAFFQI